MGATARLPVGSQSLLELRRTARAALVVRRYAWAAAGAEPMRAPRYVAVEHPRSWQRIAKRSVDVLVSLAHLPFLLPVVLVCAAAIKIESSGPVFVPQVRIGKGGNRFRTWRLRTTATDPAGDRVTVTGRLLRSTHLDLLPQLLSVLKGDMSLVGPRPESYAIESLPLWYTGRFEAKPGITGLAQISTAHALDPDESARLDIAYVRSWTLGLDVRIMARSAAIAVGSSGNLVWQGVRRAFATAVAYPLAGWRSITAPKVLSVPELAARMLVVADVAAIGLALALAYTIRFGIPFQSESPELLSTAPPPLEYVKLYVVISAATAILAWHKRLFHAVSPFTRLEEAYAVAEAVTLGTLFALATAFFYRNFNFSRLTLAYAWVTAVALTATLHVLFRSWLARRYARGLDLSPTIVVGSPSGYLLDRLQDETGFGIDLLGWVSPNHQNRPEMATTVPMGVGVLIPSAKAGGSSAGGRLPWLGSIVDVGAILAARRPERVMVVEHGLTHAQLLETIDACERQNIPAQLIPPIYDLLIAPTDLTSVNGIPTLRIDEVRSQLIQNAVKRIMDIVGSALLLLLLSPLLIGIAVAIRRTSPGPVLFRQTRGGRNGRPFNMLKFRTMVCDAEARLESVLDINQLDQPAFKIVDDPRITPVGRWLRRFSLDELPQLFNVLKGDMTLVGPRPEELRLVQKYDVWQRRRLKMKPGITGLQQVVARGALADLAERVRLDIYYTRNQSFLLDVAILFRTVGVVLSGKGAT